MLLIRSAIKNWFLKLCFVSRTENFALLDMADLQCACAKVSIVPVSVSTKIPVTLILNFYHKIIIRLKRKINNSVFEFYFFL